MAATTRAQATATTSNEYRMSAERHGERPQYRCTLPALQEHRYTLTAPAGTSCASERGEYTALMQDSTARRTWVDENTCNGVGWDTGCEVRHLYSCVSP